MSSSTKAIILALAIALSFTQINGALGSELNVLTYKEFQKKIHSKKIKSVNLENLEINNDEMITLYRFPAKKRMIARKNAPGPLLASLK